MSRVYLRNASAPRRGELYLCNHFLVDAICVLPIVVPEEEGPSCLQVGLGRAARGL